MSCGVPPVDARDARSFDLAPQSVNIPNPPTKADSDVQWKVFSDASILGAAVTIADSVITDQNTAISRRVKHLRGVLTTESPGMFDGIDFDNIVLSGGALSIPFERDGKKFTILVIGRESGSVAEAGFYEWAVTGKYRIMVRPEGLSEKQRTALENARILSDFLAMRDPLPDKADLAFVFGNEYIETAIEAANLLVDNKVDAMIITGGIGHSTKPLRISVSNYLGIDRTVTDNLTESELLFLVLKHELKRRGWSDTKIGGAKIFIEKEAGNAQQNTTKSMAICLKEGLKTDSVILIQRPDIQRRSYRTFLSNVGEDHKGIRVYNHAALVPGPILLMDKKTREMLIDETDKMTTYEKPMYGFISPSEGDPLPGDVRTAFEALRIELHPDLYIAANGKIVGNRITVGAQKRTSVDNPIQIESRKVSQGTDLANFSQAVHKKTGRQYQGIIFLKSGKARITLKEAGKMVRDLVIMPGDIVSVFGDSDVRFEEDSEFAAFRQTDELKTQANLAEVIKGEVEVDGSARVLADGKVVAEVYRGQAGDLEATVHRAAMGRPAKMVMITPQSAAMGVGLKIATGLEDMHRHERDGQSRMEALICMGGKCTVDIADKDGRGPSRFDVSAGEVLATLPWSSHGYDFKNADIAMVIQDPARGVVKSDKVMVKTAPDPKALQRQADVEVENLVTAIMLVARQAQREGKNVILGVETGLVPAGENATLERKIDDSLLSAVRSLEGKLRAMGMTNVSIVTADINAIAQTVSSLAAKTQTPLSNVVVLASKNSIYTSAFDDLKTTDTRIGAFLAGVDTSGLKVPNLATEVLDAQILEMLTAALMIAAGKEPPNNIASDLSNIKNRIIIFLPKAEPIQYEQMENLHKARLAALAAA